MVHYIMGQLSDDIQVMISREDGIPWYHGSLTAYIMGIISWFARNRGYCPLIISVQGLSKAHNIRGKQAHNIMGAKIIGANMTGANIMGANIMGANIMSANIMGANITGIIPSKP